MSSSWSSSVAFPLRVLSLALVALASAGLPANAAPGIFRDVALDEVSALPARRANGEVPLPRAYRLLAVDADALRTELAGAPGNGTLEARRRPLLLALPFPDGSDRVFRVEEAPIMEPALQERYPELRTYLAQGVDDPTATARLSLTPFGFHAMVLGAPGGTVMIDPYRRGDASFVLSYRKRDGRRAAGDAFRCEVEDAEIDAAIEVPSRAATSAPRVLTADVASGTQLRTYRLALAATGEYTTAVCTPNPAAVACGMSAMVISVNRVVGIYEREVAIRMVLIANNDLLVYTNGTTDPYNNGSGSQMLSQNQTNINNVIGSANYDIGHVFSTGGGGVASLAVPCTSSKARGVTGSGNPVGDGFDVDYVAHEMGHQFGGAHTFNGTTSNCGGGNRSSSSAYEPGSGSTIMAYAGICGGEDLQPHSDDTFHPRSFDQIVAFSTTGNGNNCAVTTATGNLPPVVDAGASYTVPKQTPFTLTGSATDPDGDSLTYMWEEFDLGTQTTAANIMSGDLDATRPIFRSFVPLGVPARTFPRLANILSNTVTIGEVMSTRTRTMTFRLTARDNRAGGGGVDSDTTTVAIAGGAGPFAVTAPNSPLTWYAGTEEAVTWDVAGTSGAPVSCSDVAVELSTDGGLTFPTPLLASTPNDGQAVVTVPAVTTATARVRVSCVGNVFFDIGNADFAISESPAPSFDLVSLAPTGGPTTGGTVVVLTGTGFAPGAAVLFGTVPATAVVFAGSTTLLATAPIHPSGATDVVVTNPDLAVDTLAGSYLYSGVDWYFFDGFEPGTSWSALTP